MMRERAINKDGNLRLVVAGWSAEPGEVNRPSRDPRGNRRPRRSMDG
jgi:hypothetical protein